MARLRIFSLCRRKSCDISRKKHQLYSHFFRKYVDFIPCNVPRACDKVIQPYDQLVIVDNFVLKCYFMCFEINFDHQVEPLISQSQSPFFFLAYVLPNNTSVVFECFGCNAYTLLGHHIFSDIILFDHWLTSHP